jgi:hypothetical protein
MPAVENPDSNGGAGAAVVHRKFTGLFFNAFEFAASISNETSIVLKNDHCCSSYGLLGVRSCRAAFKRAALMIYGLETGSWAVVRLAARQTSSGPWLNQMADAGATRPFPVGNPPRLGRGVLDDPGEDHLPSG